MNTAMRPQREVIRVMLADLKMPGSLEAVDSILARNRWRTPGGDRSHQSAAVGPDYVAQQPPLKGGHAIFSATGSQDVGVLRLFLPTLAQAAADREFARARLR